MNHRKSYARPLMLSAALFLGLGALTTIATAQTSPAAAAPSTPRPWEVLPATAQPLPGGKHGYAAVNGIKLYYSEYGSGSPIFLLHGGPANQNYLSRQVAALMDKHRVILVDTRGHGRSTRDARPLGYDLFANDVVALMDTLNIKRADFLGWSDGGITALDLAMRYPERVGRVMAFGANTSTNGTFSDADKKPAFAAFLQRAEGEYRALSATPNDFQALNEQLGAMYATQPDWTPAQLRTIKARVLIADGDHDEAIRPEHTRAVAQAIPGAKLVFFPNTSHFAFLQDTVRFNAVMLYFFR